MRVRTIKPWYFTMLALMLTANSVAQVTYENLSFDEAQAKAQQEGKIIFVDVMRSGPMPDANKQVEDEVFTIDSIANFFRDNCVSIRMDMGSEAGKAFAPNLNMLMYPAYVFYDAEGAQLAYTNAYSVAKDPAVLMEKARASSALAEEKQVNTRSITFADQSWAAVLEQAKASGKLIFLDAQTEWCRPCRMMERDVFTLDRVADFYNDRFINVSMDMEKGDGPALAKKYEIKAYPTYLFIDGDGNIVHRDGGFMEAAPFLAVGQKALETRQGTDQGISFLEDGTWEHLLARAAREDKLIFLDGYAVWCGPCKAMDKNVFTRGDVGAFFNETFINVKRDMEKGEGITLKDRYDVKAYPTYLFINARGEEVHRIVGSSSAEEFLANARIALEPDNQLASLQRRYESGERSSAFIQQYVNTLAMAYRQDQATAVATDYLDALPKAELFTDQHWAMAKEYVNDPNSAVLTYLATHRAQLGGIEEDVDLAVENMYSRGLYHVFSNEHAYDAKALKRASRTMKKARLPHADELTNLGRLLEAGRTEDWKGYGKLLEKLVEKDERVYRQSVPVSLSVFGNRLLRETGAAYSQQVLRWTDMLLPTLENKLDRSKVYDLKQLAYEQAGDEENAKLANTKSKELVAQWSEENKGSGMMMAIPMKLQ